MPTFDHHGLGIMIGEEVGVGDGEGGGDVEEEGGGGCEAEEREHVVLARHSRADWTRRNETGGELNTGWQGRSGLGCRA